jgi:preprotein translocase subunit SecE
VVKNCSKVPTRIPRSNSVRLSQLTISYGLTQDRTFFQRRRRCRVHSSHDLSPSMDGGSQNDQHSSMPPHDEIDKALLRLQQYARNPMSAVIDLRDFAVASVFLMRHVHTPRLWKSILRACVVMIVVVAFMSMIWGLDLLLKQATAIT